MSASNAFETKLLTLLFINTAYANFGDAGGLLPSAAAGNFEINLHTGTLTDTSIQTTTVAAYTSYAAVLVARGAATWSVTNNIADNDAVIAFPACTGGPETETDFSIGSDLAGAGTEIYFYGALTASLAVSNGITPQFAIGALDITLD